MLLCIVDFDLHNLKIVCNVYQCVSTMCTFRDMFANVWHVYYDKEVEKIKQKQCQNVFVLNYKYDK